MTSVTLSSSSRKTFKWNSLDRDNRVIVVVTRCCALHLCWWCITRPPGTWVLQLQYCGPTHVHADDITSFFVRAPHGKHFRFIDKSSWRWRWSETLNTVVPSWLSAAGMSQEVWSLILVPLCSSEWRLFRLERAFWAPVKISSNFRRFAKLLETRLKLEGTDPLKKRFKTA